MQFGKIFGNEKSVAFSGDVLEKTDNFKELRSFRQRPPF